MDSAGERFAAIQEALADRKNILTVKELCELAGVSRSGYYNWVRSERARETREQKDRADFERILEAYQFRGYAKGARGIHMRLLHMGVRVNKRDLRPGDLVFFRTRAGMHVGFYDTDHNFLHASSSQGVMRSSLDNPYWESAFYQARRLPKEYNAQITMNSDTLHLAKNRR